MNRSIIISFVFILLLVQLKGQTILPASEAIQISLENNYNIKLARNFSQIAENNTSRLNTGELPSVSLNSGINYGVGGSEINYNDENIPASSTWVTNGVDYNAAIAASYLIYDFNGRELKKERLGELLNEAKLEERRSIELNMLAILSAYYNIARIQENLYAQEEVLEISRDRRERVQFQLEYGKANRLAVLNASVDINRDSIDLLNLQQQLENEKRDLNLLLGRDVNTDFEIDTSLQFEILPAYDQLLAEALSQNIDLLLTQKGIRISELDIDVNNTILKPRISANSSVGLFGGLNDNQVAVKNQFASDFTAGLSLSWNIFDGGSTRVRDKNYKVLLDNQQVLMEQVVEEIKLDLRNSWELYQNQRYIMQVEAANIETANLNFDRTAGQFKLGQVSSVEFRQAQLNKLMALVAYNRAKFIAKMNEISLLQLSGRMGSLLEVNN